MRKILFALVLTVPLAACVSTQEIDQSIAEVQAYTRTICKFVPTITTVAKIIASGTVVDTTSGIANGICNALTTAPLADGPGPRGAYYRGVLIVGTRVK